MPRTKTLKGSKQGRVTKLLGIRSLRYPRVKNKGHCGLNCVASFTLIRHLYASVHNICTYMSSFYNIKYVLGT